MDTKTERKPVYRIAPSLYWPQYWYPWPVGIIATIQLIMAFGTLGMEIGNVEVDLYRSNVYSGFWSFPFMVAAIIATYACVCSARTQTKAIIALGFQVLSIVVMFVVVGFLMAFIASNYTLCISSQCSHDSLTIYGNSTYAALKQGFIASELACSLVYIAVAIMYIIFFVRCFKQLPRIHPVVERTQINRQISSLSRVNRTKSSAVLSYNVLDIPEPTPPANAPQKVCPNCKHVSLYDPDETTIKCPKCKYQSFFVEHGQQA